MVEPLKAHWLRAPTGLTLQNLHSAHTVFMCFVFISEQTTTYALYNVNWLVFVTEMKTQKKAVCASSLKG
jgi:hypothetical protein